MFESLKYIENHFPYFLDKSKDSNLSKITGLIDEEYINILNGLEAIRTSYYFIDDYVDPNLFTWHEHIVISPNNISDMWEINVYAPNLAKIYCKQLKTGEEQIIDIKKGKTHASFWVDKRNNTHYLIKVTTYDEYTYLAKTNEYNPALDLISKSHVGATRRNYKEV